MTSKDNPIQDLEGKGIRPPDQVGGFEYFTGDLKTAYEYSRDNPEDPNRPFLIAELHAPYEWAADHDGIEQDIHIKDNIGTEGAMKIKMNVGWQAAFFLTTNNNDFFEDSIAGDYSSVVTSDWPTDSNASFTGAVSKISVEQPVWVQDNAELTDSRTAFVLNGDTGDYFSADIDSNYNSIAQFRVRINQVQYFNNTEIDDELYIKMVWLRKYDPDKKADSDTTLPPTPEVCDEGFVWNPVTLTCDPIGGGYGNGGGGGGVLTPVIDYGIVGLLFTGLVVGYLIKLAVKSGGPSE